MSRYVALAGSVVLVTAGLAVGPVYAQQLEIGGRLGPAITTLAGDGSRDSNLGFSVAGFAGYRLGDGVTIYGELSVVRKGFSSAAFMMELDGLGNTVATTLDWTVHLDYLELQVPVALVFPTGGRLRPRLYAGPSLAIELRCGAGLAERSEVFAPGGELINSEESEVTGDCVDEQIPFAIQTKTIDVGILFGGGLDIRIGRGALTADLRYDLGLSDIDDSDATLRNRAFQVLLGYSYFLR